MVFTISKAASGEVSPIPTLPAKYELAVAAE